jgi:NADH-quinone oxidoreductase subunit G
MRSDVHGGLKAAILLNAEPSSTRTAGKPPSLAEQGRDGGDSEPLQGQPGIQRRAAAHCSVHETSGSFVNAEGRLQSFHAVVKPLADTRPAWKVLRVLANMMGLPGVDYETIAGSAGRGYRWRRCPSASQCA